MFVAQGLSGIIPILHGVKLYGMSDTRNRVGFVWLGLEGFMYILGAGLYAVSVIDVFLVLC